MPFDGTEFQPRPDPARGRPPGGKGVNLFVAFLAIFLGVMPFSVIVVIDTVRYVASR